MKWCELSYWSVYAQLLGFMVVQNSICLMMRKKVFFVHSDQYALSTMDVFQQIYIFLATLTNCMIIDFFFFFFLIRAPAKSIGKTSLMLGLWHKTSDNLRLPRSI